MKAEKKDAKKTHKGFTVYNGHLAQNRLIIGDEFRENNAPPAAKNVEFIKHCGQQLPKNKFIKALRRFLLKNIPSCMSFFPSSALCQSPNTLSMQTLARLEYEKKSCSIWYILFRQSP
ncbi:MAG: hypothetical protein GY874_23515 [Desulfobacteraceae bacterium]|nr:hypothetical protein [Desulfobacteraceae bacterium]